MRAQKIMIMCGLMQNISPCNVPARWACSHVSDGPRSTSDHQGSNGLDHDPVQCINNSSSALVGKPVCVQAHLGTRFQRGGGRDVFMDGHPIAADYFVS